MESFKQLSAYRVMWLFVMFDLPVGSKKQRREATKFRQFLLDLGFEMSQFSVYLRYCASLEQAESLCRRVQEKLPEYGRVSAVTITDKQYEGIRSYQGRNREPGKKKPDQLTLF